MFYHLQYDLTIQYKLRPYFTLQRICTLYGAMMQTAEAVLLRKFSKIKHTKLSSFKLATREGKKWQRLLKFKLHLLVLIRKGKIIGGRHGRALRCFFAQNYE